MLGYKFDCAFEILFDIGFGVVIYTNFQIVKLGSFSVSTFASHVNDSCDIKLFQLLVKIGSLHRAYVDSFKDLGQFQGS